MLTGVLLMGAAVALLLHNQKTVQAAGEAAAAVVEPLAEAIMARASQPIATVSPTAVSESQPMPVGAVADADEAVLSEENGFITILGEEYAGILEIPELNLALPIYAECTTWQLETAPCRYTGSAAEENLVIAGHNYDTHFGKLLDLSSGDTVYFTDAFGRVFAYEVALMETLAPYAVEEMTAGEYPLTLFTCTYGGQNRVAIRCRTIL